MTSQLKLNSNARRENTGLAVKTNGTWYPMDYDPSGHFIGLSWPGGKCQFVDYYGDCDLMAELDLPAQFKQLRAMMTPTADEKQFLDSITADNIDSIDLTKVNISHFIP